jgi:hypothetical protein
VPPPPPLLLLLLKPVRGTLLSLLLLRLLQTPLMLVLC